jgi:hypothetical protein
MLWEKELFFMPLGRFDSYRWTFSSGLCALLPRWMDQRVVLTYAASCLLVYFNSDSGTLVY